MDDERRRWPRQFFAGGRLPPRARVHPGDIVTLVNVSSGGALVESDLRFRWGARCDLEWVAADSVVSVAARVVRCFVARLDASAVRYRTALRFDATVTPPLEQDLLAEYQVPSGCAPVTGEGVVSARHVGVARIARTGRAENKAREKDQTWHRP